MKIEGLLMNSRMVQGIFDDLNPRARPVGIPGHETVGSRSQHARVHRRDARVAAPRSPQLHDQPSRGSPQGYSQEQPWHNSAFKADGRCAPITWRVWSAFSIAPTSWAGADRRLLLFRPGRAARE